MTFNRGDIVKGVAVFPRTQSGNKMVQGVFQDTKVENSKARVLEPNSGEIRLLFTATLRLVAKVPAEPEPTPRGKILREAETLITGDRNKNYGSPTENFDTTAALWNAQMGHKLKPGESFTATDVALLMVQLKMARLKTSLSNRDHYLDIAGYIACGWECQEVEDASA